MRPRVSRRDFLKAASAAAGASALPAGAQDAQEGPEVLVVSGHGPDHPLLQSILSQLLEQGVWFETDDDQNLPSRLPASLEGYRAVLLDEPAAEAAMAAEETRRRLDDYARRGGYVFCMETPPRLQAALSDDPARPARDTSAPHERHVTDLFTSHRCNEFVIHAGLTRFHPGARRRWIDRGEDRLRADLRKLWFPRIGRVRSMSEFALHDWKAALAWIGAGHEELRPALIREIEGSAARTHEPLDADEVSGLFGLVWLSGQTGDRRWLEKARETVDALLLRRPRVMGLMSIGGFADDPLGLGAPSSGGRVLHRHGSVNRRDVVWTEFLHFHGPVLAALSRAIGEPKYLREAMKIVEHVRRYHLRPDGLLAHATREGRRVSGAWTRGQTHALYGLLYMLEELAPEQPEFRDILDLVEKIGLGLRRHQDPRTGLWRNLVDHPAARLESSGTTGITYVFARCLREGWLDRERFEPMVLRAWEGVRCLYWRAGLAANCRGSGIGDDAYYLGRPQGWARLPHLVLALLEMQRRG